MVEYVTKDGRGVVPGRAAGVVGTVGTALSDALVRSDAVGYVKPLPPEAAPVLGCGADVLGAAAGAVLLDGAAV